SKARAAPRGKPVSERRACRWPPAMPPNPAPRRHRAATSRTASRPHTPNQGRPSPALVFASLRVERRSNQLRSAPIPHLRDDQRAIAGHPARFKVVACGRRWGKTTLGLALAVAHARQGRRVWWVAPTYRLAFQPWRTLKAALYAEWVH